MTFEAQYGPWAVVAGASEGVGASVARQLGERGIFTWDGHYFALDLARRLDVEASGGWLRVGLVHYNTAEEVERVVRELKQITE